MNIILANPRGFCAGVSRAINVVEKVLSIEKHPIYVRHEVVHNKIVVDDLKQKGAIFVAEINEIPDGSVCIYSAHGVSESVVSLSLKKNLKVYDATCPLVTKVHREVQKASKNMAECVLIGHKGHPEVDGTMGQYSNTSDNKIYLVETIEDVACLSIKNPNNVIYATQTTLSVDETKSIIDALKIKYPKIISPKKDDICYATQNRQNAIKSMAKKVDIMIVVGSKNSSNSNRLRELSEQCGVDSYLIDSPENIDMSWFDNKKNCGITAGASAPEYVVQNVVKALKDFFNVHKIDEFDGIVEDVLFPLPKLLQTKTSRVK